ncbi:MAG: tetratricopeptide repeat protein [Candidatus Acidiferrales bacterium]|jgi:tetratricopeptide (TPR) repeat protein
MSSSAVATIEKPAPPTAPKARLFGSPREATLLIALLLALVTLALYEPSLHNGFVSYDDPSYIINNARVHQGLSWDNIRWAFTTTAVDNWHPLTWIAYMADVQLFRSNPLGHHLVNVLLHTLNVVLLFLLLRRATGCVFRSAMVAGLFAVFPLNVENVAWVAELKSVLCVTFVLLALWAYGWYARRPGVGRYLAVAVLFAFALMAKPLAVTLPFALLLVDYWPLNRLAPPTTRTQETTFSWSQFGKLFAEKIPLFLLSAGSALLALYAQRHGGTVVSAESYPLQWRIKNVVYSYLLYILKGLWPSHLSVFYPYPGDSLGWWKVAAAAVVLFAITMAVWSFRQHRYLLSGWLWYLGTMVPMIGIVQVGHQAIADRYAYLPFLGLFVLAVWLVSDLAEKAGVSRVALAVVAFAVLAGYAATSYIQSGYWRDSYALFSHAADVTTGNAFAEENVAESLAGMGRPDLAMQHYETAVRYLPRWSNGHYNFAFALQQEHRFDEAIHEYQLALAYETDADEASAAHGNLGAIFVQRNQLAAALSEFSTAIRITPTNGLAFLNRGLVEYSQGSLDAAANDFSQAVQFMPAPKTYFWLGRALEDKGALGQAASAYETVLRMDPDANDAKVRLNVIRPKLHP